MRVNIETGTQRVMRILVAQLATHCPTIRAVQSQGVFEPNANDLPVVRLSWRQRSAGLLTRMEYPVGVEAIPSDYTFTPKATGRQENAVGTVLVDTGANFSHVRVGDKVVNISKQAVGTVVRVQSLTSLVVKETTFAPGDAYAIHWPVDAEKHYVADRRAILELDIYAAPDASYGQDRALDDVERKLMHLFWTEFRDALQAEYIEVESVERVSDAGSIIASGLGADWYERGVLEVSLIIGDGVAIRKPTVESVPIPSDPRLTVEKIELGISGFKDEIVRR